MYLHQSLLYDACQGSVVSLTALSKKLVDKAGPDATAIILSELNSVQDQYEDATGNKYIMTIHYHLIIDSWLHFPSSHVWNDLNRKI